MKALGIVLVTLGLALFFFGIAAGGCATAPGPFTDCNPVMHQCSPADLPPLTEQLPAWPYTRLLMPIEYADAFQHAERKPR